MTSSISWIDPAGLATTLARMGMPRPRQAIAVVRPPVEIESEPDDASPVEIVDAAPSPVVAVEVEEEPEPDGSGGEGSRGEGSGAEEDVPEFVPSAGPLRSRLDSFLGWLTESAGAEAAFVVDSDGLPLIDRSVSPSLLAIAASVLQLIETINGKLLVPLGSLVEIELEEKLLSLVSVDTPIGRYLVGQVGRRSPSPGVRQELSSALRRVFRYEGD